MEENNVYVVSVPANCKDRLQPMDLSVNKSAKEFMQSKLRDWYATQVKLQLDESEDVATVDLRIFMMKSLNWSRVASQPI